MIEISMKNNIILQFWFNYKFEFYIQKRILEEMLMPNLNSKCWVFGSLGGLKKGIMIRDNLEAFWLFKASMAPNFLMIDI